MPEIGKLVVRIGAATSEFEKGLQGVEARIKEAEKQFKGFTAVGKRMASMGKALTMGFTLPIAGLGAAAVKSAMDLESAFTGVRKTVEATEEQLAALKHGFEEMATRIPVAIEELYGIGEAAGQLGIKTENILKFTEVMAKLGVTTNLSADQAATALARLANITQMPQTQFDRLGSTVVALGNNLATTEAEIVEMGLRLAGAGKQIGLTEAQILALAGALSSVGIEAEAGGSAMSKAMIEMANAVASGNEKLAMFAAVAGMSAKEFAEAFRTDAAGALIAFIEGLGRVSASGQNTFAVLEKLELSEIRVRDALLRASGAGDLFRQSIELGNKAWTENIALNKEAAQRFSTGKAQLQLFANEVRLLAGSFGELLAPSLLSIVEKCKSVVSWLSNLDERTKKFIITIAGIGAAIGPGIWAMGQLFKSITDIRAGIIALSPVLQAMKLQLGKFFAFVAANPIVAVIAGITAAVLLLRKAWTENWGNIQERTEYVVERIKAAFWQMVAYVGTKWNELKRTVYQAIAHILDVVAPLARLLPGPWKESFEEIRKTVHQKITDIDQNMELLALTFENATARANKATEGLKAALTRAKGSAEDLSEAERKTVEVSAQFTDAMNRGSKSVVDFSNFSQNAAQKTKAAWEAALDRLSLQSDILRAKYELMEAQMGSTATESEKLAAKLRYQNDELALVKQRVDVLNQAYERMKVAKGANAEETQKLYLQLLQEKKAQAELEAQIKQTNESLKEQARQANEAANALVRHFAIARAPESVARKGKKAIAKWEKSASRQEAFTMMINAEVRQFEKERGRPPTGSELRALSDAVKGKLDIMGFQKGGILLGNKPLLSLLHPPEAVVPLDRGKRELLPGPVNIAVYLDGRPIARATLPHMHREIVLKAGLA